MDASLLVDIDRVPPLSVSAPQTARSGSSSGATPRTGGGTARSSDGKGTARSSDGKGTPRDCERLPLGTLRSERASGNHSSSAAGSGNNVPQLGLTADARIGGGVSQQAPYTPPVPSSPLTTWRSGAISSPASSQGAASSRSLVEPCSGAAPPLAQGFETQQVVRPAWLNDMSREIEVMRHVIMQENRRLREQIRIGRDEACCLRQILASESAVAAPCPGGPQSSFGLSGCCAAGQRSSNALCRKRVVEWRIRGVDGQKGTELAVCAKSVFDLPEYPDTSFCFKFGAKPRGQAPTMSPATCQGTSASSSPCHLMLRVSGNGCACLCLRIGIVAEADTTEVATSSAASLPEAQEAVPLEEKGHSKAGIPLGGTLGSLLSGGGRVACPCSWPQVPGCTVVCRAQIEFAGFKVSNDEPLRLVTVCDVPRPL
mmetsp:Transcript_45560/g.90301  ORF Transcript_45560/g.90301 Transcript_45560/m.90301 type:complete len:428 (+) Transcript_45560:105-1388(+)|eukprot:CAMPEP_0172694990 /NCGR_PEP_ID=MMETSP1074-20121228/27042_1 /TAXON_ID=2916 /ORGANISM="Ceratium fusus, Strain PA161109" /LENGTH=427 /DNA_ID=CAMNT_0013515553 /DNA_START=62 /DNA_END=1341 /DNA_ORIENTATION=-